MLPLACVLTYIIYIIYVGPLFRILGCNETPGDTWSMSAYGTYKG